MDVETINIALLTEGWTRFSLMSSLKGMFARAKERGIDLFITQFCSFGEAVREDAYNQGEYSVYNLVDASYFDAIILDVSDMPMNEIDARIFPLIRKSNIPVLALDSKFPGIHTFGQNNKKSIEDMMDHLYRKHNVRSFAFFGGPSSNFEANARARAYADSLVRFGLNQMDNPIYVGNFEYDSGFKNMEKLIFETSGHLPGAIVCANDRIAIGALEAARKRGYSSPKDFIITGFDNYGQAERYTPQITTVGIDRLEAGKRMIDVVCDLVDGKDVPEFTYIDGKMIYRESCGCESEKVLDYRKYAMDSVLTDFKNDHKRNRMTSLMADLSLLNNFEGYFKALSDYPYFKQVESFLVSVDKGLFHPGTSHFSSKRVPIEREFPALFFENGESVQIDSIKEIKKRMSKNLKNKVAFVSALHFGKEVVGYVIVRQNADNIVLPDFVDARARFIFQAESLYKTLEYSDLSKTLSELYNNDQLTGIHNRIFFDEEMVPAFDRLMKKKKRCAVFFIDADNFKSINDTYGHNKGDLILKTIAKTIDKALPDNGDTCRFGGDEFVAYFPVDNDQKAYDYATKVEQTLLDKNIHVSVGVAFSENGASLSDIVNYADKNMYKVKFKKYGDRRRNK
ncbi:MAG: GGDEF domain-containing protein [Bacilli bacterium]|nr:GGDEF domain-containing protein [Bacilli bacterium]